MVLPTLALLLVVFAAFAAGFVVAQRLARRPPKQDEEEDKKEEELPIAAEELAPIEGIVPFDIVAERGTEAWRSAMAEVGRELHAQGVVAIVFAHGSFVGNDPLS